MSRHVLVAVDGSSESEKALEYVLDELSEPKLTLVHVVNPVSSFGYGGDGSLYFQFGFGESSRKRTFLDSTTQATLVVSDVQSMTEWTSVVVAGPIEPVDDAEDPAAADAFAAFADNAFVPRNALDGDLNATDFTLYELSIESATGRFGN